MSLFLSSFISSEGIPKEFPRNKGTEEDFKFFPKFSWAPFDLCNQFLFSLFGCQQAQSKQPTATAMMTGLKGDEIGASVAPCKQHYTRVRVDGATVL